MSIARKSIQQQAAAEQAKVQSWQRQRQADIDREAEELRRKQREEASKAEQQAQAEIAKAEKAIATARKQRALGVEPDLAGLKANKEKAIESQKQELSKAKEAKTELQKAEKEAKAEVETIAKEATTELEAQQRLAMAEVAKLQEDNVELDNGEWMDKETYNSLSTEDQAMINKLGVEKFNRYKQKEFESNNVKLSDGSWVSLETYNSLPPEQQNILRTQGIAGYEKWQQEQIAASNADSWKALQDLITATGISSSVTQEQWNNMTPEEKQNTYDYLLDQYTVTVGNDEIVSKGWYEDLNPEFRAIVTEGGTAALDKYIADNYVTTNNEELIDKEYYNSLTTEQKDYILRNGSDKFQQEYFVKLRSTQELIDKKEYEALPPEVQKMLHEKGITETNNYIEKQKKEFEDKYVKLDNGDYIDKDEYYKMTPQDQALLRTLGVAGYNAKKQEEFKKAQEDYIKTLPKEAQDYIKLVGFEKFNEAYRNALKEQEAGRSPDGQLKIIGLVPDYAENVTIDKNGTISYEGSPNYKNAKTIDLNSIDYNNLTMADYYRIAKTLRQSEEYDNLSYRDAVIRYANRKLTGTEQEALKKLVAEHDKLKFIDVLSFIFPPAQALKPEITIADIKGTEWAEGIANIGLLFVAPAVGAIGKAGSAAAKAASIASKGIQAGAMGTYTAVLAKEWKNMDIKEQAISVALNVGILGAIYGKPLLKGLKAVASKTGAALGKTPVIIEELAKAAKAKDVNGIRAAAQKLEEAGSKIKGANGRIVVEQSHYLYRQAKNLVNLPKGSNVLKEIQKLNKSIVKHPESYMGGTGSPFNKNVNDAAEKIVEQTKRFDEEIRRNVIKPEGAKTLGSSAMTEQQRRLARLDLWQLEPKAGKTMAQVAEDAAKKPPPKVGVLERGTEKIKLTPEEYAKSQKVLARILKQAKPIKRSPRLNLKIEKAKAASASKAASQAKLSKAIQSSIKTIQTAKAKAIKQVKITESMQGVIKQVKAIDAQYAKISEAIKKVLQEIKSAEIAEIAAKRAKQLTGDATPAEIAASKARLSSASIASALTQAQNMTANKAIQMLMRQNMITAAIATAANTFTKIFEKASSKAQEQVYKQVSPAIASQLKTLTDNKASESLKNKVKTNVSNQAKIEIKALTSTLTEAEIATQEVIKNLTETTTQSIVENIAEVAPANITKEEVENLVDSYVETITQPEIKEIVEPKKADIIKAIIAKNIKPPKKTNKIKPFRPIIIKDENGKEVEITEEQLKAAVGWKQGWAYWYIYPPAYGKGGKCRIIRKTPIKGIPLFKDAKSAYLSLTKIGKGELPRLIEIPMGITDLIIRTAKGGKPKSQYKRKAASSIPRLRTTK